MKQIKRSDYVNAYEYKQAKRQLINNVKIVKTERKNKRNINFN